MRVFGMVIVIYCYFGMSFGVFLGMFLGMGLGNILGLCGGCLWYLWFLCEGFRRIFWGVFSGFWWCVFGSVFWVFLCVLKIFFCEVSETTITQMCKYEQIVNVKYTPCKYRKYFNFLIWAIKKLTVSHF